jgi:Ferritin-like
MIDRRDELIRALEEACEIEHGLMIQYLYAALTMKRRLDEGLTTAQQVTVRQWMAATILVAREEMGHFATVCNLLAAIGAAPHFMRPNMPRKTGYYPFPFDLQPFGDPALYRFMVFELPQGMPLPPPPEADLDARALAASPVPDPLDYIYVGELYEEIRASFRAIPERDLFIGPPSAQNAPPQWDDMDMRPIATRADAEAAIGWIIEQGEGTPGDRENSHYDRFADAREAYFRMGRFPAARAVPVNPATREQRDRDGPVVLIRNPLSLRAAETLNAIYAVMLSMLQHAFSIAPELEANAARAAAHRQALQAASHQIMSVGVRPLAEWLSEQPLDDPHEPARAGPTFELYGALNLPPWPEARWVLLFEALDRCAAAATELGPRGSRPAQVAESLRYLRRNLHVAVRGRP